MDIADLRRPRWGTFSVIDHLDPAALIDDVLLFDKLVLPTPSAEEGEEEDWIDQGWRPDELAKRIVQLGDLVYTMPWTKDLRREWRKRWERLKLVGVDSTGVAYGLTPHVLAMKAWDDYQVHADEGEERPDVKPVVVAAYQNRELAKKDFGVSPVEPAEQAREIEKEVAALFTRKLAMPVREGDAEEAFNKAVSLAGSESFQKARRALFAWEDSVATREIPVVDAIRNLEESAANYDELVKTHFRKTATRTFVRGRRRRRGCHDWGPHGRRRDGRPGGSRRGARRRPVPRVPRGVTRPERAS